MRWRDCFPLNLFHYYNTRPSRLTIYNYREVDAIRKDIDSLEFRELENKITFLNDLDTNLSTYYRLIVLKKLVAIFIIGTITGIFGAFQTIVVEEFFIFKYGLLENILKNGRALGYLFWMSSVVVPTIGSAFLVIYFEPTAKGTGISYIIAFLNGTDVPGFMKVRVLVVKYFSTFLSSAANLPGGRAPQAPTFERLNSLMFLLTLFDQEEPFVHMGALLGASLASFRFPFTESRPFSCFSGGAGRRDLATAGAAAGVAAAFGTPIGALLFCLEEGLTFWNPELTFMVFICTLFSTFFLHLIITYYKHGLLGTVHVYLFFGFRNLSLTYLYTEIPVFIFIGIIGSVSGSLWNYSYMMLYRGKSWYKTSRRWLRLMYAAVFGLFLSLIGIAAFHAFQGKCRSKFGKERISQSNEFQVFCTDSDSFDAVGVFLFQDLRYVVKSFEYINSEETHYFVLLFGIFYFYVASLLQFAVFVPSGVLVPHFASGAAWGYLFATWMSGSLDDKRSWAQPVKYSFLGAVAQASGVARLTLSLGIIMIESCGQASLVIPIFIIVITTKWFASIFTRPIYRIMVYNAGYALIRGSLLPVSVPFKARDLMVTDIVTLPPKVKISELMSVLLTNRYHAYPIMKGAKVRGLILRSQILALVKSNLYKVPTKELNIATTNEILTRHQGFSFKSLENILTSGNHGYDLNATIDLVPYMNPTPYCVNVDTSLRRLYLLFVALALTTVLVVDGNCDELNHPSILKLEYTSPVYVSESFESLDYERVDNEILIEEEEEKGKIFMASIIIQRILLFCLIGIITGIFGAAVEIGVHMGGDAKYHILKEVVDLRLKTDKLQVFTYWFLSVSVPATIGCAMVVFIEPKATGGGTSAVLGYLNGVNLREYMTMPVLLVKSLSTICCVISNLPGGKEGPLIHVGAILGCLTPLFHIPFTNLYPFEYFHQDPERRDMAAGGTAAGLTAAFSTPIGGILLAIEESLTYWNVELTFLMFICALTSEFVFKLLVNTYEGCPECASTTEKYFLSTVKKSDMTYVLAEIPFFIFLGILGGFLGSFWNLMQKYLIFFRKKFVNSSSRKMCEIIVMSLLTTVCHLCIIYSARSGVCIPKKISAGEDPSEEEEFEIIREVSLFCKDPNTFSVWGLFLFQHGGHALRSQFTENEAHLGIMPLIIFFIFYYFVSCLLLGCNISHGIFMPLLLLGAVWGRLIAETIQYFIPEAVSWARPNKIAFLCGAAQLSGCLRITFAIGIIMLETTGATELSVPIFLVVSTTKLVGNVLTEPLYHMMCNMSGIPMLDKEPPPCLSFLKAKDIMSKRPLVTLPLRPNFALLHNALSSCEHNGFPVVNGKKLLGSILRSQVKAIIKHKLDDEESIPFIDRMRLMRKEYASVIMQEHIALPISRMRKYVDLTPYMNSSPFFVNKEASFSQAYVLLSNAGLRHLIVVDENLEVVGIITRKDLSVYRLETHLFHAEIVKLPLRP